MISETVKNNISVDLVRIRCFLENNQLVQANALTQKINSILEDAIKRPNGSITIPETDSYFILYRTICRMKTDILCGKSKEALEEVRSIK